MAGNKAGGIEAAKTNRDKYGHNFYGVIGAKGGANSRTGGFAAGEAGRERARIFGAIGGSMSRRGKSLTPEQRREIKQAAIQKQAKVVTNTEIRKQLYAQKRELSNMQVSKLSERFGVKKGWR